MGATTKRHQCLIDCVVTDCYVYSPEDFYGGQKVKRVKTMRSLWDTGASTLLISNRVVDALGLRPIGKSYISSINQESDVRKAFLVHIGLPTGDIITDVVVTEIDSEDYDMVIGMGVISKGDFAITNKNEKTTFSFRIPSKEEIDFV